MKLSLPYKVFSIVLALLVLVSTLSVAIEKHFCGGVLVDVAVFTDVDKCCGDSKSESQEITKNSCCKNEIDIVEGQDEITIKAFEDLDIIQEQVLVAYAYAFVNLYESLPKQIIPHKDYSPPLLIRDIQVLDETYLI
ncbi:hypothetical protein [Winogradskyella sp.]|uniref:HYC_CC_PP family protein n=1 Tax=Winogradskyella sp. TaxID=1883156 RepID=UPI00261B86C5|nr:hypothetical protein [Winogradskyella sp.]